MSNNPWTEQDNPIKRVFDESEQASRPPLQRGPIPTLSLLELDGLVVWDERKGFWSPAPGKGPALRLEFQALVQAGSSRFPYVEDIRQALYCWPFWARYEQLAPGSCPRLTPAQREDSLRLMERIRRTEPGSATATHGGHPV